MLVVYEDTKHMIMSCQGQSVLQTLMFTDLENNIECSDVWCQIRPDQVPETLLGGNPLNLPLNMMMPVWRISMTWLNKMYRHLLNQRAGIG